jgi:translation elongation factor EF-G
MTTQYGPDKIRNVILLSHYDVGKTTLAESMLFTSGTIKRLGNVQSGTTVSTLLATLILPVK